MLGDVEVVEVKMVEAEAAAFDVDEEAGTAAVVTDTLGRIIYSCCGVC